MKTTTVLVAALASTAWAAPATGLSSAWTEQIVTSTECSSLRAVDLEIAPDGTLHLLYYHDSTTGGRGEMRHANVPPGLPWSQATHWVVGGNASHRPSLAVNHSGDLFAARCEDSDQLEYLMHFDTDVWYQVSPGFAGGAFGKGGMGGDVATDLQGSPVLAHFVGDSEDAAVSGAPAGSWTTTTVDEAQRVGKNMHLDVGPQGCLVLAYLDQDGQNAKVAAETAPGSASFDITALPAGTEPQGLRVDAGGTLHLLCGQSNGQPPLSYWTKAPGGQWQQDISFPSGYSASAAIHLDANDVPYVAARTMGGAIDLVVSAAGSWTIQHVTTDGSRPDVEVTPEGKPIVAYMKSDFSIAVSELKCGTWSKLGCSLAGATGLPTLTGSGCLCADSPFSLVLTLAAPLHLAWLVLSTVAIDAPFKGGCLVPQPDIILPVITDAAGGFTLSSPWPQGVPPNTTLFSQVWIQDNSGAMGFAASNGLAATTAP